MDSGTVRRCPEPYPLTLNYYWLHFSAVPEEIPEKSGHARNPELVNAYCELLLAEVAAGWFEVLSIPFVVVCLTLAVRNRTR